MENKPKYSVVMPVLLNRAEHEPTVKACIESVQDFSEDYEFIIVDDGSKLDTEFLRNAADTYIRHNPTNRGIAPSWNDGIRVARGEFIVVINDDIQVREGWLDGLAKAFEYEKAGVSAPAVSHMTGGVSGIEEKIERFPGYCFMLKRSVINDLFVKEKDTSEPYPGHFDESFVPFNGEDVDYWHRLTKAGYKMYRAWDVKIWHAEGDTIHYMNYDERSKQAIAQWEAKHGFDPRTVYYR